MINQPKISPATRRILQAVVDLGDNAYPSDVGGLLYPELSGRSIQGGGPSRGAVAAAWQLGRLRKRGLVEVMRKSRGHQIYYVTAAGQEAMVSTPATD